MCRNSIFPLSALCGLALGAASAQAFTPTEDGLYAVIDTTAGEFAARLHYDRVPMTVANFVRLAEGTMPIVDSTGEITSPRIYEGLNLDVAVAGEYLETASLPDNAPGYTIPDEFLEDLTHNGPGVLSMSIPTPNLNNAQFIVSLQALPAKDWRYPVFGQVVEGMDVVEAINTGGSSVVINTVTIVREGTAASAWDEMQPVLPMIAYEDSLAIQASTDSPRLSLRFQRDSQAQYRLQLTDDLLDWSKLWDFGESLAPTAEEVLPLNVGAMPTTGGLLFRGVVRHNIPREDMAGYTLEIDPDGYPPLTVALSALNPVGSEGTYSHTHPTDGAFSGGVNYWWYNLENTSSVYIYPYGNLAQYIDDKGTSEIADDELVFIANQPQQVVFLFDPMETASGAVEIRYYNPSGQSYPDQVISGTATLTAPSN